MMQYKNNYHPRNELTLRTASVGVLDIDGSVCCVEAGMEFVALYENPSPP